MLRQYFVSDSLDALQLLERQLEAAGITTPRIHVLSRNDTELERRHLHAVQSLMQKDMVRSGILGAAIGVGACALVLAVAYFAGWTRSAVGWAPFVLLAIVALGFCTWVGGLIGIQTPNRQFRRFEDALNAGRHVFFVDLDPAQQGILERVLKAHPSVQRAGTGSGVPHWLIAVQETFVAIRRHWQKS